MSGARVSGRAKPTRVEAAESYRRAIEDYLAGLSDAPETPTLAAYFYSLLAGPYRRSLSANSWELYEALYRNHIETDPLGLMPIDQVRPYHVEQWAASLKTAPRFDQAGRLRVPARPVSPNTCLRYMGALSGVFERARLAHSYVGANPVRDAQKPATQESEFRILTVEEIEELLELADRWERKWEKGRADQVKGRARMIVLLGLHGLGPAEMAGQRREDFDGVGLVVRGQAQNGRPMTALKTRNRRRWIPVDDELKERILQTSAGYLLRTGTGRPMQELNIRRAFAAVVKGSDLEGLKPYDLRHTCAMRLLEEGADVRTVAEILGNSPEIVLRRYAKSRPELKVRAISRLRRRLG